jgi:hypothetical protein
MPPCGDALHERKRRQRERCGVEQKAAGLHRKAEQPGTICKQQTQRLQRVPQRERRQSRRGVVLAQVGETRRRRRKQREGERDRR